MFPEMVEEKKTGHIKWIYVPGDGGGKENRSHKMDLCSRRWWRKRKPVT
jgi:hypothetical protein